VPPPSDLTAAACAFSAAAPVTAFSASSCAAVPWGGPLNCGAPGVPLVSGVLVVPVLLVVPLPVVVAAPLDAAPNTVAPTAPPASSEPAIAAVVTPLRIGFIVISLHWRFPRVGGLRRR